MATTPNITDADIDAGLIESGVRRADADAQRARAAEDLAHWARLASQRGRSSRQIAALAGVSHTLVQRMLNG